MPTSTRNRRETRWYIVTTRKGSDSRSYNVCDDVKISDGQIKEGHVINGGWYFCISKGSMNVMGAEKSERFICDLTSLKAYRVAGPAARIWDYNEVMVRMDRLICDGLVPELCYEF